MTATGEPVAPGPPPREQAPPGPSPSPPREARPATGEPESPPHAPSVRAHDVEAAVPPDTSDPEEVWARICESAPGAASRALLGSLTLRSIDAGRAVLAGATPEAVSYARSRSEQIGKLMRERLGRPVRIEIVGDEAPAPRRADIKIDNSVYDHPLVRQTMALFDAQVIGVEEVKQPPGPDIAPDAALENEQGG